MILLKPKQRFTTWLALMALIFATAATPLSHSFAKAGPPAMDMAEHDHHAHGMVKEEAAPSAATNNHDAMPMPCDQGCSLCKNCALCSLQAVNGPAGLLLFLQGADYIAAPTLRRNSHIAAQPSEPPRV
jgi:hypothetical protein